MEPAAEIVALLLLLLLLLCRCNNCTICCLLRHAGRHCKTCVYVCVCLLRRGFSADFWKHPGLTVTVLKSSRCRYTAKLSGLDFERFPSPFETEVSCNLSMTPCEVAAVTPSEPLWALSERHVSLTEVSTRSLQTQLVRGGSTAETACDRAFCLVSSTGGCCTLLAPEKAQTLEPRV